jgi:hypothetical protein
VLEELADPPACRGDGSLGGFSEQVLELSEDLLDGIEVWRIRRQEEELCTDGC